MTAEVWVDECARLKQLISQLIVYNFHRGYETQINHYMKLRLFNLTIHRRHKYGLWCWRYFFHLSEWAPSHQDNNVDLTCTSPTARCSNIYWLTSFSKKKRKGDRPQKSNLSLIHESIRKCCSSTTVCIQTLFLTLPNKVAAAFFCRFNTFFCFYLHGPAFVMCSRTIISLFAIYRDFSQ